MTEKKVVLMGILGTIVLVAIIALFGSPKNDGGQASADQMAVGGTLTVAETRYDFGTISMAAGKVSHEFMVTNTSTDPATIEGVETSCMCTEATLIHQGMRHGPYGMPGHGGFAPKINEVVGGGEEAQVEVVFDPAAHGPAGVGPIERMVSVKTTSGQQLDFGFSANVTP